MMKWSISLFLLVLLGGLILLSYQYRIIGEVAPDDFQFVDQVHLTKLEELKNPSLLNGYRTKNLTTAAARMLKEQNYKDTQKYALLALQQDITNGRAAALLLAAYDEDSNITEDLKLSLAQLASKLWPAHTQVHQNLADYWLRRQNINKLLYEWDILLRRSHRFNTTIFPALLELTKRPDTLTTLHPFAQSSPIWWKHFFRFIAQQKDLPEKANILKNLYNLRLSSPHPITPLERNTYLKHLVNHQHWQQAYIVWLSGLSPKSIKYGGHLFDGGFETKDINSIFSWTIKKHTALKFKISPTRGMQGTKALNIRFNDRNPVNFRHLQQRLLLSANDYQLSFKHRVDKLETQGDLRWRIYCSSQKQAIAESTPIKTKGRWQHAKFSFTIPLQSCSSQILRLEAGSPYKYTHYFDGSIWLDDLNITVQAQD